MSSLIERLNKSREFSVNACGFTFSMRRPTDFEVLDLQESGNLQQSDILNRFVIGWSGVNESDLICDGENKPVAFSSDLFMEWIADRADLWAPLTEAVTECYQKHTEEAEAARKKL